MAKDPTGWDPALRTIAMPADTNPAGDIFGGWLLSQMDLAGGSVARSRTGGRVVTVAIEAMTFHEPVEVGDEVSCYANVRSTGNTSVVLDVVAFKRKQNEEQRVMVTEGVFVYVLIDEQRRPLSIPADRR